MAERWACSEGARDHGHFEAALSHSKELPRGVLSRKGSFRDAYPRPHYSSLCWAWFEVSPSAQGFDLCALYLVSLLCWWCLLFQIGRAMHIMNLLCKQFLNALCCQKFRGCIVLRWTYFHHFQHFSFMTSCCCNIIISCYNEVIRQCLMLLWVNCNYNILHLN